MFCKYCGTKIAEDSVFCAKCGKNVLVEEKNVVHKEKRDVVNSVRIQIIDREKNEWKSTDNLQWVKPIGARIVQVILLAIGFFFLFYGIDWSIKGGNVSDILPSDMTNDFSYYSYVSEPLLITINFYLEEYDRENQLGFKEQWEKTRYQYEKWWESNKGTGIYSIFNDYYPDEKPLPADWANKFVHFKHISDGIAIKEFREKVLSVYIIPAIILIVLSIIWIIITAPKSNNKSILPRDLADKIENYTWSGFTLHKYIRYIKNDKYGILDAANRSITVPATFDLIEWREANKSYDGVLDGSRKTYNMDLK